jgi:hypothetical protein
MSEDNAVHKRREFCWSKDARDLVQEYKDRAQRNLIRGASERRLLVGRLAEISGNPRDACLRFLRHSGVKHKQVYREWTKREQQRLVDLVTTMTVDEAANALGRPIGSVRSMLHRLGIGATRRRDWFTKFSLSRALHTHPEEIQKWIDHGWLKARAIDTSGTKATVIYADDFCDFVKQHGRQAVSRRLNHEALWFVQNYVFPPSHAELLEVRGTYHKRVKMDETKANSEVSGYAPEDSDSEV